MREHIDLAIAWQRLSDRVDEKLDDLTLKDIKSIRKLMEDIWDIVCRREDR